MNFPLVVSFCTAGTPYELEIETLKASCDRFGIEGYFATVPSNGSWVKNCALKGPFIDSCLKKFQKPILWLDADAEILKFPSLLGELNCDFAAYKPRHLLSGTLFFAYSQSAIKLVDSWSSLCVRRSTQWDQRLLENVLKSMERNVEFLNLPQGYCKIFDRQWQPDSDPTEFIIHRQASRIFKSAIDEHG